MSTHSIGIAGAGIMGRLLALALRQQGHRVTVFDQDPVIQSNLCDYAVDQHSVPDWGASACSYTAAGMLTPYTEADVAEPLIVELGQTSLQLWPGITKQLGAEVFYRSGGTLILSHQQDRADYNRFQSLLHTNLATAGTAISPVGPKELSKLEPELGGRFQQALYAADEAWLCSCCVMPALFNRLIKQKVAWHSQTHVRAINPGEIVVETRGGHQSHYFDWAVDTRGIGAREQQKNLRGVRGEILWLKAPDVKINRLIRLMHPRYRIYIVPRRDDLYLLGATQIESEDSGPISVRSSLELLSAAYSVHPGFGEAQIVHSDTNLRPAYPNNQPQVRFEPGFVSINGLFRHGYLMSPAIALEVATMISNDGNNQSTYLNLFQQHQNETLA